MKTKLKKFAKEILNRITSKPKSKYQAFAYAWDRGIIALLAFSAFITNQAGILLVIIAILATMFFGMWLVSKGR